MMFPSRRTTSIEYRQPPTTAAATEDIGITSQQIDAGQKNAQLLLEGGEHGDKQQQQSQPEVLDRYDWELFYNELHLKCPAVSV